MGYSTTDPMFEASLLLAKQHPDLGGERMPERLPEGIVSFFKPYTL